MKIVEEIQNLFGSVAQLAVADDVVESPGAQVIAMIARYAIDAASQSEHVVGPAPAFAFEQQSDFRQPIDGRERPCLRVPIIPAQPSKYAQVLGYLLLPVQAEAVLVSIDGRQRHVGIDRHLLERLPIISHMSAVQVGQQS